MIKLSSNDRFSKNTFYRRNLRSPTATISRICSPDATGKPTIQRNLCFWVALSKVSLKSPSEFGLPSEVRGITQHACLSRLIFSFLIHDVEPRMRKRQSVTPRRETDNHGHKKISEFFLLLCMQCHGVDMTLDAPKIRW